MNLSYSNYKTYLECPRKYKLIRDRIAPPEPQSKYFALYGITIGNFFEYYTNHYLKQGIDLTDEKIHELLGTIWNKLLDDSYVNWGEPWCKYTSADIFRQVYDDVLENIKAFDFFKRSRSEVPIKVKLNKSGDSFTCRFDFLVTEEDGSIAIIDGKGTDKIGKNIDPEQLLFYALMHILHYKKKPDKLGFYYYKLRVIDYLDFTKEDIIKFKNKLALVKKTIKEDTVFAPKVMLSKGCKWCPYQLVCKEFMTKKASNRAKRSKISQDSNGGVVDIAL